MFTHSRVNRVMTITRRDHLSFLIAAMGAAGLSACATPQPNDRETTTADPVLPPLAGVGVIAVQNGQTVLNRVKGFASGLDSSESRAPRAFTADSPFRVASISKFVIVLTARAMAKAGRLDLDAPVNPYIGEVMRHPAYPDIPISVRHLLSHQSGISDPAVYWTEPSGDIRSLLSPDMFNDGKPGAWFEYANINYGLAATVMEAASKTRLDKLTQQYVLGTLGLDAGFNWAGVSLDKRRRGATLYRDVEGAMTIQIDGPKTLSASGPLLYGDDPTFNFDDYVPGTNGTLLSPQGGLRASLNDLLVLAKALGDDPDLHTESWRYDGTNGADDSGHFVSFGPGLYVYPPELSPIPGQRMVGHHGEAYGLYGGMWHLPQINAQIVHVVTATPQPPKPYFAGPPAMAPESRALLDEAMSALTLS